MLTSTRTLVPFLFAVALAWPVAGCGGDDGSGGGSTSGQGGQGHGGGESGGGSASGGGGATPACPAEDPMRPDEVIDVISDPAMGMFTMDQALDGLPEGPGPLRAIVDTDKGVITCELRPDKAPIGVANFVGLARGVRPWLDPTTGKWVKRRFYDGLLFHRVIPDFVIQGGDPLGNGSGGPGYEIAFEASGLTHDAGALAYASQAPASDTAGSQFYITDSPQHGLDGDYSVFGLCTPLTTIQTISHVPTNGDPPAGTDTPLTPLHMKTVVITRCKP